MSSLFFALHCFYFFLTRALCCCKLLALHCCYSFLPCVVIVHSHLVLFVLALRCCFHLILLLSPCVGITCSRLALPTLVLLLFTFTLHYYYLPWLLLLTLGCLLSIAIAYRGLLLFALCCCCSPWVVAIHLVLMLLVEVPTSPSLMLLLASYLTLLLFPLCCFCLGCYTSAAPLLPCAN